MRRTDVGVITCPRCDSGPSNANQRRDVMMGIDSSALGREWEARGCSHGHPFWVRFSKSGRRRYDLDDSPTKPTD